MHLVLDLGVELLGQQRSGIEIDDVVDGVHLAHLHELGDDLTSLLLQAGSQLTDGDLIRDGDLQLCVAGLFQLDALQALELGLALALLELLALALAALGELLLVALRGRLAAVLRVLGGSQIVVTGIKAVHVHIHGTGIHGDLIVLAADGDGLGRGSACLGTGLTGQLAQGDGLLLTLLMLLGLLLVMLAVIVFLLGLLGSFCRLRLLLSRLLGGLGFCLFLSGLLGFLLLGLLLRVLGGSGLLGAVQISAQVRLAIDPC